MIEKSPKTCYDRLIKFRRAVFASRAPRRRKKAIIIGTKLRLFPITLCLLILVACTAQPAVIDTLPVDTSVTPAESAQSTTLAAPTDHPTQESISPGTISPSTQAPSSPSAAPSLPTEAAPSSSGTTAPTIDTSLPTLPSTTDGASSPIDPTLPPQTEHIHFFGEWHIVEADCVNDGYKERFCDCGERECIALPALGHDYIDGVCSRCGDKRILDEPDDTPLVGTAYSLVAEQSLLGETLYFNGAASSGVYLATTADPTEAATVYLEQAQGGFYLYFFKGEEKLYIDIVPHTSAADKAWVKRVHEPSCVYVWDKQHHTLVTTLGERSFFLGSYDLYGTLSAIDLSYITGENASAIGVSFFPAFLLPVEA